MTMIRVMKPHASGHKNTCKGRGMNLLLPIEQPAKHIMSASALSRKLQALSALWDEGCWNPIENVWVRRGILLPETDFHCVRSHKNKWDVCSIKLIDSLASKSNRVGVQSEEKMAKFSV